MPNSKHRVTFSFLLFLVAFFCNGAVARASVPDMEERSPFFFIQFSDPQFGFMDGNKSITAEVEAMKQVIATINRLKPPFVIVTGDFVNYSESETQIAAYKRMLGEIDSSVKVYMIPGNHDVGVLTHESIDAYKKNYGDTRFSFQYGECAFIGIDSNVIKNEDTEREAEQYEWLEQELAKAKEAKFKFVFTHCPIFLSSVDEAVNYSNFPLAMREKYVSLFQKHHVNAVFAGHLHDNAYGKAGDMEMITIGAVGKPLGKGYQGMNIVKVYPDKYSSEYMALDKFPQQVTYVATDSIRFNSVKGLMMAGYQGWFNTPEDGAGLRWKHFEKGTTFAPGSCTIDIWPDVSEYKDTYETAFSLADGTPARVFSSRDASTTDLHFKWMQEYGIDGAYMQRFVVSLRSPKGVENYDAILNNAVDAAEKYDRAICVMYDLSGMVAGEEDMLINDWKKLNEKYKITSRKNNHYLYHKGKPLVAVWGIGFNDNRKYGFKEIEKILDFLRKEGCSILAGVPTHWRTLAVDALPDVRLHEMIKSKVDVVHPWLVGRFDNETYEPFRELIKEDALWCKAHGKDYMPVLFPGFSWHNMKAGVSIDQIPRAEGRFFWKQVVGAVGAGAECLYLAMFDEIDEGTAFFKCTNSPPVGESTFLTLKGVAPDYYLWLAGEAGKYLRGELKSDSIPVR